MSPLFAIGILWQAHHLGVPRIVQLRMIVNVAIDALVGALPFLGDLFDFVWKANDRNMMLLERHATHARRPAAGDWLFVGVSMLIIVAIAAIPFVIVAWMVAAIRQYFS